MSTSRRKHRRNREMQPQMQMQASGPTAADLSNCICNAVTGFISDLLSLSTQMGVALQQQVSSGGSTVGIGGVIAASIPLLNNMFTDMLQLVCSLTNNPSCITSGLLDSFTCAITTMIQFLLPAGSYINTVSSLGGPALSALTPLVPLFQSVTGSMTEIRALVQQLPTTNAKRLSVGQCKPVEQANARFTATTIRLIGGILIAEASAVRTVTTSTFENLNLLPNYPITVAQGQIVSAELTALGNDLTQVADLIQSLKPIKCPPALSAAFSQIVQAISCILSPDAAPEYTTPACKFPLPPPPTPCSTSNFTTPGVTYSALLLPVSIFQFNQTNPLLFVTLPATAFLNGVVGALEFLATCIDDSKSNINTNDSDSTLAPHCSKSDERQDKKNKTQTQTQTAPDAITRAALCIIEDTNRLLLTLRQIGYSCHPGCGQQQAAAMMCNPMAICGGSRTASTSSSVNNNKCHVASSSSSSSSDSPPSTTATTATTTTTSSSTSGTTTTAATPIPTPKNNHKKSKKKKHKLKDKKKCRSSS